MPKSKRDNLFSFAHSVVGLEVLRDRICAVALRYKRKKWTVLKKVKKSIPASSETSIRERKITEALNELEVKTGQVVTSLSSSDMIVKLVHLPPIQHPEQELPALMEYELERQLPIPLAEAVCDYQMILPQEREGEKLQRLDGTTVLLTAIRRSKLNDHLALLESAGVSPEAVMPSFLIFLNALFVRGLLSSDEAGFIGAVKLSASVTDVIVVENGALSFVRSFIPKVASRSLEAKPEYFGLQETPDDFLRELHNTLRDFLPPKSNKQLTKLIIVTEDESLPFNLTMESLTAALAFPHCEHEIMSDGFALGLAAGYLKLPNAISLNLMKPLLEEQRAREKMARKTRALQFGPVVAMFTFAIIAVFLFHQTDIAQKQLTEAKAAQQIFAQKVDEKKELKKLSSVLSRQIETLQWVDAGYPPISYRLYQIANSIPSNVWLKEVNTPPQPKRKKKEIPVLDALIVTGYAFSQADFDDFIQQLRELSCFSKIRQDKTEERLMNKQKVLLFQLSLHSEPVNDNG